MAHRTGFLWGMALALAGTVAAQAPLRQRLHEGWRIQSAAQVAEGGETLSTPAARIKDWIPATLPTTVVGAQVSAGIYKDPFRGLNLRSLPGMTYPVGLNSFANQPMDKASPYATGWWHRTSFPVPAAAQGQTLWLRFEGLNYRANVWINGRKLADSAQVMGAYRVHEFEVTSFLRPGEENVLAVEAFAPSEKQLGINWVDWSPTPPDKSLGFWGDVVLSTSGPVRLRHPQVVTRFADPGHSRADLTVRCELKNATDRAIQGTLEARIGAVTVRQPLSIAPHQTLEALLDPGQHEGLRVAKPRLWSPAEMGSPERYDLRVRFLVDDQVSDEGSIRFGIREMTSELTKEGYRLFKVNGKPILVRGAGWAPDLFLQREPGRLDAQLRYVQDLGLNTLRLEAPLVEDRFLDLCDEKGILVMAGWCCCDVWERWSSWGRENHVVAVESLRSQILRLRSHPSLFAWLNASDGPPTPEVERAYLEVLKTTAWPNPVVNSAADATTPLSGPSGLKMSGPYDYEPPSYWLSDERRRLRQDRTLSNARYGGAYGFNTEAGPGAAIPPLESLRKMLPESSLWPVDAAWAYHSAGERFMTMAHWHKAMDATYGKPRDLEDYLRKAQAMAYDAHRAMFEAYGRNKYTSTGIIQWMLNNPWPSTFWHLFDSYLYPAGSYFGTKKACEPLHIQYSYDDASIAIVSTRREAVHGLKALARVLDPGMKERFSREVRVDVPADGVVRAFTLPKETGGSLRFVDLTLKDASDQVLSRNVYWLPAQPSTLDWERATDTAIAPIARHEDLRGLAALPQARLQTTAAWVDGTVRVRLTNPGTTLAFQVHLGVRPAGSEEELLPVLWEDNYVSLLPGETRTLTAQFPGKAKPGRDAVVVVEGWNLTPTHLPLAQ